MFNDSLSVNVLPFLKTQSQHPSVVQWANRATDDTAVQWTCSGGRNKLLLCSWLRTQSPFRFSLFFFLLRWIRDLPSVSRFRPAKGERVLDSGSTHSGTRPRRKNYNSQMDLLPAVAILTQQLVWEQSLVPVWVPTEASCNLISFGCWSTRTGKSEIE